MEIFYRKPGKLGATTMDVWAGILARRRGMAPEAASAEVAAMVADGRLAPSPG